MAKNKYSLTSELNDKCNLDLNGKYRTIEEVFEALRGIKVGAAFLYPNAHYEMDFKEEGVVFTLKISYDKEYKFTLRKLKNESK